MTREQYLQLKGEFKCYQEGKGENKNYEQYKKGDRKMSNTNLFIYYEGSIDLCKFEFIVKI